MRLSIKPKTLAVFAATGTLALALLAASVVESVFASRYLNTEIEPSQTVRKAAA